MKCLYIEEVLKLECDWDSSETKGPNIVDQKLAYLLENDLLISLKNQSQCHLSNHNSKKLQCILFIQTLSMY